MAQRTRFLCGDFRKFQVSVGSSVSTFVGTWIALALLAIAGAAPAGAVTFGQIGEPWGSVGTGTGQFFNPGMLGVDPETGDVFTGDYAVTDKSSYRIQKFTETGDFIASVEVSKKEQGKPAAVHGIAVDPKLGRIYVVQGCRVVTGTSTCGGENFGALHVLAFDMAPVGQTLVLADTFDLPVGNEELYNPTAIAVNPLSGDILVLAEDLNKHKVVQAVHSDGTVGSRFIDTADVLKPPSVGAATALTVAPDGTAYTLTGQGSSTGSGAKETRAWELSPNLTEIKQVSGFAAVAESEGWTGHLRTTPPDAFFGGPTIAVSPDGGTLYWKELEGSKFQIRGYSLSEGESRVLYGGGTTRCQIQTEGAGIGATGENLVVFDYGPTLTKPTQKPTSGYRVLVFGPGGTGCPGLPSRVPVARFKINGQQGDGVSVGERETVSFDASNSQLQGDVAKEAIWDFGDKSTAVVKCPPVGGTCGEGAGLTTIHKYTEPCECTITLEIKLEKAPNGDPVPIQHALNVEFREPPKMFPLSVAKDGAGTGLVSSDRTGIYCGGVCDREFEENRLITLIPAAASGSVFAGWSGGCAGSGLCQVTMNAAKSVTATFDAVLPSPLPPTLSPAVGIPPRADVTPEKTKPKPRPNPKKVPPKCRKLKGKARARCVAKHRQGKPSNHTDHGRPGSRRGSR